MILFIISNPEMIITTKEHYWIYLRFLITNRSNKGFALLISLIISLYLEKWIVSCIISWITVYLAISSTNLELMIPGFRTHSVKMAYNGFSIMMINMTIDLTLERINKNTFLFILKIIIFVILIFVTIRFLEIPKIKVTRDSVGIILFSLVEIWKLLERTAKYVTFGTDWSQKCLSIYLTNYNKGWTSRNDTIDRIIKETQYRPVNQYAHIEWIPYERFKDINMVGKGGFGTVHMATWIDGPIYMRGRKVFRKERNVAIKSFGYSNKVSEEFLKELESHIKCLTVQAEHHRDWISLRCFGLTQDPKTKAYMIVTDYAKYGDLQNYLKQSFSSLKWLDDKLRILVDISKGLKLIHDVGLVHHDLHSGNVLIGYNKSAYITDFGLSHPVESNETPGLFGVVPFLAPELFRGEKYTKESDIYSFGIIMWIISSGHPPFCDKEYDLFLALDICGKELRPNVIEGTPKCYVDLMKRCWNSDPSKRPKTDELYDIIRSWYFWKNRDQFIAADNNKLHLSNYTENNQYYSKFINTTTLTKDTKRSCKSDICISDVWGSVQPDLSLLSNYEFMNESEETID